MGHRFEIPPSIGVNMGIYPGYFMLALPKSGRFAEFYVLNAEGKAEDCSWQLEVLDPVELIDGIANHECEVASDLVSSHYIRG